MLLKYKLKTNNTVRIKYIQPNKGGWACRTIWLSYRELTASVLQFLGSARQFSETLSVHGGVSKPSELPNLTAFSSITDARGGFRRRQRSDDI